jgi:hypothetical protein
MLIAVDSYDILLLQCHPTPVLVLRPFFLLFKEYIHLYLVEPLNQPCPTRRPRYTFLAPFVSTLFEPIININSNFETKNILECLSTVKYFHKISLKHGTVLKI